MSTIVPIMSTLFYAVNLQSIIFGKTRRAVLALLYNRPEQSFYTRQIIKLTGTGNGAVQRELKQLSSLGIITRKVSGNQVFYQANRESTVFSEIQSLVKLPVGDTKIGITATNISVSKNQIESFCQRHHIRKLSLFGSVLRNDFKPDSDIDVLVEFEQGRVPGFGIVTMEDELTKIMGRKVDLRTPSDLSKYFREQVVRDARVQYEVT